jgi:DNA-binding transcriptional MerR regulator
MSLTVDELAAAVGLTVRTTRYYASLGLLPPPVRRGRVAYYGPQHRARLELVRALQDHGFTLQAIERILAEVPPDAGVEELALQRAMLTSWSGRPATRLTRTMLEEAAGRPLTDRDLALLVGLGSVEEVDGGYVAMPNLAVGVELLDVDIPEGSMEAASEAIGRHMDALAEELTVILREQVLAPFRSAPQEPQDAERMEQTVARLRRLTLEAVVTGFQRAANAVITRSLARE